MMPRSLTPAQRRVLFYVACGYRPAQIAERLLCSHYTVLNHLRAARETFGAPTATAAVVVALRSAQIPMPQYDEIAGAECKGPPGRAPVAFISARPVAGSIPAAPTSQRVTR